MRHFILAIFVLGGSIASAMANFPTTSQITPPELSAPSFQVAGIYWLPDYLKGNAVRAGDSNGGGDVKGECGKYGLRDTCIAPETSTGTIKIPGTNLTCQRSCICDAIVYKYDASNCKEGSKPQGTSCNGKYNTCSICYAVQGWSYTKPCTDPERLRTSTQECGAVWHCCPNGYRPLWGAAIGSNLSSCPNNQKIENTTDVCSRCISKICQDYNSAYLSSPTAGQYCEQVASSNVGGLACYICQSCASKFSGYTQNGSCSRGQTTVTGTSGCNNWIKCEGTACPPHLTNCQYGCNDSTRAECSGICESCKSCSPTDCSSFTLGSAPANATYTSCKPGCGDETPKYKLTACNSGYLLKNGTCLSDTCSTGSKTPCSAGQTETARNYPPLWFGLLFLQFMFCSRGLNGLG